MKKVVAYECEYCKKYMKSRSHMKEHEQKCIKNPDSKSCITCKHLGMVMCLNGIALTKEENDIFGFKVKGTYHLTNDVEDYGIPVLNDEYSYLYNADPNNYCTSQCKSLNKLTTNCKYHVEKE
ncbi:MAG: hypothetical protein KBA02_07270 [Paludibacteraceae bacterium]|nr:hypothetical protein [Paludibacteraceae bacterium]